MLHIAIHFIAFGLGYWYVHHLYKKVCAKRRQYHVRMHMRRELEHLDTYLHIESPYVENVIGNAKKNPIILKQLDELLKQICVTPDMIDIIERRNTAIYKFLQIIEDNNLSIFRIDDE